MDYTKFEPIVEGRNFYANLKNFKGTKKRQNKIMSFEKKVKIVALKELGKDSHEIAKSEGVAVQTVYNLVEKIRKEKNLTEQQKKFLDRWEEKKLEMSEDMAELSEYIYKTITIDDIERCSLPQKVTSMAILQDKALLMRGEATQRIAFDGLSDSDLMKVIHGEKVIEAEVVGQNP